MQRMNVAKLLALKAAQKQWFGNTSVTKLVSTESHPSLEYAKSLAYVPNWKAGSVFYGKHMGILLKQYTDYIQPAILNQLESIPFSPERGVFTMAEFGANDGLGSLETITKIMERLRSIHGDRVVIQMIYNDHEKFDVSSLFSVLNDESSFLFKIPNVYALAMARNFYTRCLPDKACDAIFSFGCLHIMRNAIKFKDAITRGQSEDPEEIRMVREAGAEDWTLFLLNRAKELKPGGLMVISQAHQRTANYKDELHSHVLEFIHKHWKNLRRDGLISQEEYEDLNFPLITRTSEEILHPFQDPDSPVRKAGLRVVLHDTQARPDWDVDSVSKCYADTVEQVYRDIVFGSFLRNVLRRQESETREALIHILFKQVRQSILHMDQEACNSITVNLSYLILRKEQE